MVHRIVLCLIFCFNVFGLVELKKIRCANEKDNVNPLILTELIKKGDIVNARNKAYVQIEDFRDILSYAGFFQVNKHYDTNLFFWYFPSRDNPDRDPVILWLQGGPGVTSLVGLFIENGPFEIQNKYDINLRMYSWAKRYSMIYIDNPVGAGFSFTTDGGYARNVTVIAKELYCALKQFFKMFPSAVDNEFYLMGESYAAKFVIALGYFIHQSNPKKRKKMNLKGIAIASGFCDPINQLNYGNMLYEIGLLDNNTKEDFTYVEDCIRTHINKGNWEQAFEAFDNLIYGDLTKKTLFQNLTGLDNYYNYLFSGGAHEHKAIVNYYLNLDDIRRALHVGVRNFNVTSEVVVEYLKGDFMKSVADLVPTLLDNYKVMFYNGQMDVLVGFGLTENFLHNLKYKHISEFHHTTRCIWYSDNDVAGYAKSWGNLTQVIVRNAGHLVPGDQPKWIYDLIDKFVTKRPIC